MNRNKQKLELTWIGKNNSEYDISNIEPRILEERKDLSYGDPDTENMIIHGDNLLALKALLPEYQALNFIMVVVHKESKFFRRLNGELIAMVGIE